MNKSFYSLRIFLVVILYMFIHSSADAQVSKDKNPKKVALGFGFSLGLESLDKTIAEDLGISAIGGTWIDFRGRVNLFKYVNLDVGYSISSFKDELPFTEALVFTSGQLSGLPSTGKSKISSGGLYYSLGGRVPITKQLQLNAGFGQRRFSARRSISECTDCMNVDLDIDAGSYVRTGFSWLTFESSGNVLGEVDLLYTYYFEETFKYTITLGFFAYL